MSALHDDAADHLGPLPRPGSANDRDMIADAMLMLKGGARDFFAAELMELDLVRDSEPVLQAMFDLARRNGFLPRVLAMVFASEPDQSEQIVANAAKHCRSNGWDATELNQAYASLFVARNGLSVPFGVDDSGAL